MGKALVFPFRIDGAGNVAYTSVLQEQILARLKGLIGTLPTERVMRLNYGTTAQAMVYDVSDAITATILTQEIQVAVAGYEPAVRIQQVTMESVESPDGILTFNVSYEMVATGEQLTASISIGGTVSTYATTGVT